MCVSPGEGRRRLVTGVKVHPTSPPPHAPGHCEVWPDPATLGTLTLFRLNSRGLDLKRLLVKSLPEKEHNFFEHEWHRTSSVVVNWEAL